MKFLQSNYYLVAFIGIIVIFFAPLLSGKLPIPADSLVGLYHPWRDTLRTNYPNGYPFKNPLITDPVLQQYPYRFAAITKMESIQFFRHALACQHASCCLLSPEHFILVDYISDRLGSTRDDATALSWRFFIFLLTQF